MLLATLLICSSGCAENTTHRTPIVSRTLILAVQEGLSDAAQQGVTRFVEKASELSHGALKVRALFEADALSAFDAGSDLLFAPNQVIARADGNFAIYSAPFYFEDYVQLSQTLNGEDFNRLTGDTVGSLLGAHPLGAFYDGNSALATIREEYFDSPEQYAGTKIYLEPNKMLEDFMEEQLLAEVMSSRTLDERITGFLDNRYQTIECDTLSLGRLHTPSKREAFDVTLTFHSARMNWLMLSDATRADLTETQQAVLSEAAAYAIAHNDRLVLMAEKQQRRALVQAGGRIHAVDYTAMSAQVNAYLKNAIRYNSQWDWDLYAQVQELAQ